MNDKREREAHTAVAAYLREVYPAQARWDAIDDLSRALTHEVYAGPMPYGYWSDKAGGDALCVPWNGWSQACRDLSNLLDVLPVECWYDFDTGCVSETDPYEDRNNWQSFPDEPFSDDEYIGPDFLMTVPTIEALFNRELWRYLT